MSLTVTYLPEVEDGAAAYRHMMRDYICPLWRRGIEDDCPENWLMITTMISGIRMGLMFGNKTKYQEDLALLQELSFVRATISYQDAIWSGAATSIN